MAEPPSSRHSVLADFHSSQAIRHRRWRHVKDVFNRYLMSFGGISVIIAIVLIAFYLLYVVLPLFKPAQIKLISEYPAPGGVAGETVHYAMEEQHEIGLRVDKSGQAVFFKTGAGTIIAAFDLAAESQAEITAFAAGDPAQALLAVGMSDGTVILVKHEYKVTYPEDVRLITPSVFYPFGSDPVIVDANGMALVSLAAQWDGEQATIAALTADARLLLLNLRLQESFLGDEAELKSQASAIPIEQNITHMSLDVDQRELYLGDSDGYISYYDISNKSTPRLIQKVKAVADGNHITRLEFLSGGISILAGDT